jgi:quinolinate synthase
MAETAAILNPDKIVLLPDENAGCALADMATLEKLKAKKKEYPDAVVVSYVNSSAAIKAESDICCTSANAVDVVNSLKKEQILFLPDKNLGKFVASKMDKRIILWKGFCYVHHNNISQDDIKRAKVKHPNAKIMVHPECPPKVTSLADYVGSTAQMAKYASNLNSKEFIVGTENGMLHELKTHNPDKKFYPASKEAICRDMKLITLEKVALSLKNMQYQVKVPEEIAIRAKKALDRMLEIKIR